jgi:hypothetical protein
LLASLQIFVVLRGGDIAVPEIILLLRSLRVNEADAHQLFRMREGKAAEHECVHDGELRSHAGDAEPKNENGEDAKCFLFEEDAEADADVLAKGIENHNQLGLSCG